MISVKRLTADRHWESCGAVPADVLDEDYMFNEFGPGRYMIYLKTSEGKMLGQRSTVFIGARATPSPVTAPAPAAVIEPRLSGRTEVELLRETLERQNQMFLRLVDAIATSKPATAAAGSTVTELVTALGTLQNLMPKRESVPLPERLMERVFEMAKEPARDVSGTPRNELLAFAMDVWREMKPMLAAPPATAAPAQPATAAAAAPTVPAAAVEEQGEEITVDLTPAIDQLKDHCRKQRPPETIADIILDQCKTNEQLAAIVEELAEKPIGEILALDPELQMPGYKIWFTKLHEVLGVRLLGSARNPGGASGNP